MWRLVPWGDFLWRGECICLCCCVHFLIFQPVLTHCLNCKIHQLTRNLMWITAFSLEVHTCGDWFRKAISSSGEVSGFVCAVAVTFCSFDPFSPVALPIRYINRCEIWFRSWQLLGMGVAPATRVVMRFFVDMLVSYDVGDVAVTLCSLDLFSSIAIPVSYINLSLIWCRLWQYVLIGVNLHTRSVTRLLVDR